MKIFLLSDGNSIHTKRWVKGLHARGYEIFLFSLNKIDPELSFLKNTFSADVDFNNNRKSILSKFEYLKVYNKLKQKLKEFKPDLLHAHYASSYGLLGALSGFKPYIISVWGSDVFDFPKKSFLHKSILKFNLSRADKVLSTSHIMAKETSLYTNKAIDITPFGVDLTFFRPTKPTRISEINEGDIVIGTIKTLEEKYGIEYLIRAFKLITDRGHKKLKLLIVGKGSQKEYLQNLVSELGIEKEVIFVGWLPYHEIPMYNNMLDIAVYPSILDSESFGVSVVESGACEIPVVVSNKGGLVEVVEKNTTGLVAEAANYNSFADQIELLLNDKQKREVMGKAARKRVEKHYNWEENLSLMENIYKSIVL